MVQELAILNVDEAAENSVMDRKEHPQRSKLLIPIRMQSQETFHSNIVANFLNFLMAICMHYSDNHNKNYSHQKGQTNVDFSRKLEIDSVLEQG
jgi:hypothetical protein